MTAPGHPAGLRAQVWRTPGPDAATSVGRGQKAALWEVEARGSQVAPR